MSTEPETERAVGSPVDDLSPAPPLRRRDVGGETVTLAPLDARAHAALLFEISHGSAAKETVWTYLGYGPFDDVPSLQSHLERCELSDDPLFFTVIDNATRRPVGVVSFLAIDRTHRRVELGHIWYGVAYQRSRVNTESVYLMLRVAFDDLRCRRVEWKCDSLNQFSRRAAQRLGFVYEGVFRQHLIVKGRNRDTAWYSIVDTEWPRVRAALEQWLEWGDGRPPALSALRDRGGRP